MTSAADEAGHGPTDGAAGACRSAIAAAAAGLASLAIATLVAALLGGSAGLSAAQLQGGEGTAVSALARRDIPPTYLALYQSAARRYGLDWAILAGIGKVECDHGRDPAPSCTREGAVNQAGAGGPMQFLASTWQTYGVDGNGDGVADRWNVADAIFAAANYLRASGAPGDYRRALYAYNHAAWYVAEVQTWASRYRGSSAIVAPLPAVAAGGDLQAQTQTPVLFVAGSAARLDPADGHVAMVPLAAPAAVQAMLVAGNELQGLPYGPAGHPDPRNAAEEDCSSTVNYVLYRAGIRPIGEIVAENPLAQDYVRWGLPGPGRWVTIYATASPTPHVFVVIAGLRLDTSHNGTDVGPNSGEDGPRWRILDHIPTWAQWSVRHPPGL